MTAHQLASCLLLCLLSGMPLRAQDKTAAIDYAQAATQPQDDEFARQRRDVARGVVGTYGRPPRTAAGRVEVARLLADLEDLHANTYHWLISNASDDFEDLKAFLPQAASRSLRVWVTVLPPSEARTRDIYCINYQRWAREIAQLSLDHPNLVAWSIDDFGHNQEFYSHAYMGVFIPEARRINPRLAFVPCVYFGQANEAFVRKYGPFLDGVLFPFRNESGTPDLKTSSSAGAEIARMQELFGDRPVVLDVYASRHSRLGDSTPRYVDEVVAAGFAAADGVLIYCHQDPGENPEKYAILKERFTKGF